jgi:integrase
MRLKLTSANVRTLPAGTYWDVEVSGLGLRVRETGARTLVFQYTRPRNHPSPNKTPKLTIGTVGAVEFGRAKKIAQHYYARVRLGEDPHSSRVESKIKAAETFEAVAPRFLAYQQKRLRPRSYANQERHLLTHAKLLHSLQLDKVERRDVATVLADVAKNAGAVTSNRVRASLSAFFSWATREGVLDRNVATGTNKQPERPRTRVLTPSELALLWRHGGDDQFGCILKLLVLTAARADEIASLQWREVRDDLIVLPPERTKNGREHEIPLSAPARAILAAIPRRNNSDGTARCHVFGLADTGFSGWSKSRERLNARIAAATGQAMEPWVPHDLRRVFSSYANELGICEPHIVEAVLGHVSGFKAGVAGTYNLARYRAATRAALDRWADQLIAWVEGRETNITPLRRA